MSNTVRGKLESILTHLDARADREAVFTKIFARQARAEADAADARLAVGAPLGSLDGRIISIKSLIDIEGETTVAGSAARATMPPAACDAPIVTRLRQAGAVIMGTTAMTELAFLAVGPNRNLPWPRNARDPDRVPGGSSSGAGVSVAEDTCDIAIGSDTGDSVRIPAALNGVVGFKPSWGLVPTDGTVPLSPTLDTLGPLATSVADCASTFQIMAGLPVEPVVPAKLEGIRFGVPRGLLFQSTEDVVTERFDHACGTISQSGAEVVDVEFDDLIVDMAEATVEGSIASLEAAFVHREWLESHGDAIDHRIGAVLRRRLASPREVFAKTLQSRSRLVAMMAERLLPFDAFVLPTVPIVAPRVKAVSNSHDYEVSEGLLLRNTQVANQFDLCAISLPLRGDGLPVGLSLMARSGFDGHLLATA